MSEVLNYEEEYERSLEVFTDTASYAAFELTRDNRLINGCIDPRPEDTDRMKVKVQTTGGAIGYAHDAALTWIAEEGLPSQAELNGETIMVAGLRRDRVVRQVSHVVDAHRSCKFNDAIELVLSEEADPNDFTIDTLERWTMQYAVHGDVGSYNKRIIEAAARQKEQIRQYGLGDMLAATDELHPHHPNVNTMIGENQARIHMVNHHPHVGLNRERIHHPTTDAPVVIQAYHDSLRATVDGINNLNVPPDTRGLYAAALLVRAAASRTVLGSLHADTTYGEIYPADNESGLRFETFRL